MGDFWLFWGIYLVKRQPAQGKNTFHTNTMSPSPQLGSDSKAQHFRPHCAPHNQKRAMPEGAQITGFWPPPMIT